MCDLPKEIPILNEENFEEWKKSMIDLFKQINAWKLIENRVPLKLVQSLADDKEIKKYQDLCLKVEYLMRSSTVKEDNRMVRDHLTDDIFTSWEFLINAKQVYKPKKTIKKEKTLEEGLDRQSVEDSFLSKNNEIHLVNKNDDDIHPTDDLAFTIAAINCLLNVITTLPTSFSDERKLAASRLQIFIRRL